MPSSTLAALTALTLSVATPAVRTIHLGADTTAWTPNADGGHAPAIAGATVDGRPAVRLTYTHRLPGWGNAAHVVQTPPDAYAIRIRLYVSDAKPGAMLHVWLLEADGDAWVGRVRDEGTELGQWSVGWHMLSVPLERMAFEPRGNRTRELTTANKLLIGFNGADSDVAVAEIEWLIAPQSIAATRPADTPPPTVRPGAKATLAIFADSRFAEMRDVHCAPSDPTCLAAILERAGYGTAMLNAEHLADPATLSPKRFALLILPYGPNYPAAAEPAIRDYLMHGGGFFSTGGYVFDRPVYTQPGGALTAPASGRTITAAQLEKADAHYSFNTRYGRPGDTMMTRPDQIGAFDPAFELQRVARLVAGDDQFIIPDDFDRAIPVSGYAARSMIAKNSPVFPDLHARTIPIIEARDTLGRPRGPVGSVAYIFDGPYRGSAWAFFGVTSQDLFAAGTPDAAAMAAVLTRTVDALLARRFLYDLRSDLASYDAGKRPTLSVRAANHGPDPAAAIVRFRIGDTVEKSLSIRLAAGESKPVEVVCDRPADEGNPQEFTAELLIDNHIIDRLRSAYVPWRPALHAKGFAVRLVDNYLCHAGRPTFLTGTNTTAATLYSLDEGPLTWDRDFAEMATAGLRIVRILHFSPFACRGYQGEMVHSSMDLAQPPPERLIRQMDAFVQLAQKHGVIVFLTLHDWLPVILTDAELQAQRTWNRYWAARYKDVPGIIYDIQNEPSVVPGDEPALPKLWEDFLVERHGSLDGAWKAWGRSGTRPEPIPRKPPPHSSTWQDLQARDWDRFRHALLERWLRANAEGIREGDPDALSTIGLLQTPAAGDPAIAARAVAFSDCHFYGNVHDLAAQLKFIDRRAYGKSLSLGEFGSIPMHDRRVYGQDGTMPKESIAHFLNVGHYALGLGAGFICNWSFKDFAGTVFPWGIRHVGQGRPVPKDVMLAYRNFSLLARRLEPVYREPELALLLPDGNRFGAHAGDMQNALYASITALIRLGAPFNVINEEDLTGARMPTKAILWPCPYAVDDPTFARILSFVKDGGCLYLSGSVGFSIDRRPERAERAAALGIANMNMIPPWSKDPAPLQNTIADSRAGKGRVCYVSVPIEITQPRELPDVYRRFVDAVPVRRADEQPDDAAESVCRIPTAHGEVLIVVRRRDCDTTLTAMLAGLSLRLRLQGGAPALIWADNGRLRAASLRGSLEIADAAGSFRNILTCNGLGAIVALSPDDTIADLRSGGPRLILPFEPGRIDLGCDDASRPFRTQIGEVQAGRWRSLQEAPSPIVDGRLAIPIEPDTYLDMRLVSPSDAIDKAVSAVDQWLAD